MSVFQDEADDDGQQYAHLQAQASSLAAQQHQLSGGLAAVAPTAGHDASGNPFGSSDDGFAGEGRSVSNSVFVEPQQAQAASASAAAAASTPGREASGSVSSILAAAGVAGAIGAGSTTQPYGVPVPMPALSDVSTSAPSRVATLASLPPYVAQPLEAELEAASRSKHGKIVVGEPELRGGTFTQHHVFKVSSAAGAVEHVFRRYNDFAWLRGVLVKAFPGIFIPPLPEKKVLGSKDSTFVESRRLDLQRWLSRIVSRDFLAEHEAVSLFLHRATASFEDDCKALSKATEAKPLHETISLYMELFPELARLPASESANFDVEAIRDFLVQAEQRMGVLSAAAEKFVSANYGAVSDLGKLNSALQATVENEKSFVTAPPTSIKERGGLVHPRVDVVDSFIAWHLSLKWSSNAYEDLLLSPLKFELQDIQAMSETLRVRMDLHARHQKSVARAAKWTASPANAPKNTKQEEQKQMDEQVAKEEGMLLDLVNKLILHAQFEQFWTFRMQQFRTRLHQFARVQIEQEKQLHDTFQQVAATTA